MAFPVSPVQGCQKVIAKPFKSDLSTSREEVGMGVTVGVGITLVWVEVGVTSGVATILVAVGDGWLPQATRKKVTTRIRLLLTRRERLIAVFPVNEVRSSYYLEWFFV